jgi:membrane-associated phospholipid phosphatase
MLLLTLWNKVSIHAASAGAMIGTIIVLSLKMSVSLIWFLIPAVLIGGLIISSRLRLNSHNSFQVYLGFLSGFAGISIFMLFFQ